MSITVKAIAPSRLDQAVLAAALLTLGLMAAHACCLGFSHPPGDWFGAICGVR
jgi:hypothetical protein